MENNEAIESKARQLLDGRVASVATLADALRHIEEARAVLTSAEHTAASAWSAANDAGWTDAELRTLGLASSVKPRGRRSPAKRRQTSSEVKERAAKAATGIEATTEH